jgi:hypothetical protein
MRTGGGAGTFEIVNSVGGTKLDNRIMWQIPSNIKKALAAHR